MAVKYKTSFSEESWNTCEIELLRSCRCSGQKYKRSRITERRPAMNVPEPVKKKNSISKEKVQDIRSMLPSVPPGYRVMEAVRPSGPGHGGVAVIHRENLKCTRISLPKATSYEGLCLKIMSGDTGFTLFSIYRPGSSPPSSTFYDEFSTALEFIVTRSEKLIIGGDINIHMEAPSNKDTIEFTTLLDSFDLRQHVNEPTHCRGGTLDHIITPSNDVIRDICVDPAGIVSDHSCITCQYQVARPPEIIVERFVRGWRRLDKEAFRMALLESPLTQIPSPTITTEQLFLTYDNELHELADKFAPVHRIRSKYRPLSPWFDADCRRARRQCRRLERVFRRTKRAEDRADWIKAVRAKNDLIREKKNEYWQEKIRSDGHSVNKLWRSLNKLLCRGSVDTRQYSTLKAQDLLSFFLAKIERIRDATKHSPPPTFPNVSKCSLNVFQPLSMDEVRRLVIESPVKTSSLDPIPTFLVKEFIDELLPYITTMVNYSLRDGLLPGFVKHALIIPILKDSAGDPNDTQNYRPISNLTFISKIVEKAVALRLLRYLNDNKLLPPVQSAYRKGFSTETALLRVLADIYASFDHKQVTLLCLLDQSAAFDCVDHSILLNRLRSSFGVVGSALAWIESFLTGRTIQVQHGDGLSDVAALDCGVPQGSVLGPILFLLYTSDVTRIITENGLIGHSYADDVQVYSSCSVTEAKTSADKIVACIDKINQWMAANRLKMNPEKTKFICFGTWQQLRKLDLNHLDVHGLIVPIQTSVRNLGIILDDHLSFSKHITNLSRICFFQLRQLRVVTSSLTKEASSTLLHAFIHGRLDYCNALYAGISSIHINALQRIQNAAARLATGLRKYDHVTSTLRELHWLPVESRIKYKVLMLIYKSLHHHAPDYLRDYIICTSAMHGRRSLRSATSQTLMVPITSTKTAARSIFVYGPRVWNELPTELKTELGTPMDFGKKLKHHLFTLS